MNNDNLSSPTYTFTVRQVCQLLHIGRTTLWKLARAKKIKVTRIGRRVLFQPSDIEAFLQGGRR